MEGSEEIMKRITHKVIDGGKYIRYVPINGLQAYRKLGQLEDLMEEYNLESIEDLENLLALQTFNVSGRSNGKTI